VRPPNRLVTSQNTFRRVKESFHPEITTSRPSSEARRAISRQEFTRKQANVVVAARIWTPSHVAGFRLASCSGQFAAGAERSRY
jgi:hypothetical protein